MEYKIMEPPPYIGMADVRTYFALNEKYVRKLIAQKKIIGTRPQGGRIWRIKTSSVFKYFEKCSNTRKEG